MNYGVEELYQLAQQEASRIVIQDTTLFGILIGIAALIAGFALFKGFMNLKALPAIVVTILLAFGANGVARGDVDLKAFEVSNQLANTAITQGVDQARRAQATELQYIHAVVNGYGYNTLTCSRTVNYRDECSSSTGWYTHREINIRWVESCTTDSDGDKHCTSRRESDDEYTPYFAYLVRYWIQPDTKAKYLHPGIYAMEYADPNARPHVFLHNDWRAPQNPEMHTYENRGIGWGWQYNTYVPEFWTRVSSAAQNGGQVVVANFVGQYFHWGLAEESTQFQVYAGHYRALRQLVELPGPDGLAFNYTNAFNRPDRMQTLLTSRDGDLGLDFQPISVLGVNLDPNLFAALSERAMAFQGHAGPNKETSVRWFVLPESIVTALGGVVNATTAVKAYLADNTVWGHFQLPKNVLIVITVVSDDGTRIVGRGLETGMPFGNVLVAQRMRMSIQTGQFQNLDPDHMIGYFTSRYIATNDQSVSYEYTDMRAAGGAAGIIYEETPGYTAPDPNSDECATAPAEHYGFIRYQMCTQQYRESNIRIDTNGALLILDGVRAGASAATQLWLGWLAVALALVLAGAVAYSAQNR